MDVFCGVAERAHGFPHGLAKGDSFCPEEQEEFCENEDKFIAHEGQSIDPTGVSLIPQEEKFMRSTI